MLLYEFLCKHGHLELLIRHNYDNKIDKCIPLYY